MKFFIALLLVASCSAFSIESMIEKEAFEFLIHTATAELEKLALDEVENVVSAGGKELSLVERQVINKFAATFGYVLNDEIQAIIDKVRNSADAKTLFTKKMYENLRMAALNITEGLHMAPRAAAKFLHDMMADIEAMEKSGTFVVDIENMFKNVMHKAAGIISYQLIEKRGLSDIWSKINDTLMKVIGHLHGKFHDLHDFFRKIVKSTGEKLQPHFENIKTLAKDFLSHVNDVSGNVAKQALAFFKPFAGQLGSLWVKLVQRVHDHLQKITDGGKTIVTPEPIPEGTPEPVAKVTPEPVAKVTPEPVPEGTPEPVVKASPEPVVKASPEPVPEGTPVY